MTKHARQYLMAAALASVTAVASADKPTDSSEMLTPVDQADPGPVAVNDARGVPAGYDSLMLALGRDIYRDLQSAHQAASAQQATTLRVRIREAREALDRLRLPADMMALEAQTKVIRDDIGNNGKAPDAGLWVPIEAELDSELVYLPPDSKADALAAVRSGKHAAERGDRTTAAAQLDRLIYAVRYQVAAFPLEPVRAAVESAWLAASREPAPDWIGARDALDRALADVHWVTHANNARDLLRAYSAALDADALWPHHRQAAIERLARAETALRRMPDSNGLADQAHRLARQATLSDADLKAFLHQVSGRLDQVQEAYRAQYFGGLD